jgi:periplasmic protein TonB
MTNTIQPTNKPIIGANDRLGFTLFLAIAIHLIIVLGIGFTRSDANQAEAMPSLDIILANTSTPEQPDNPDFLAQDNQIGGGNQDEKARPSAPISATSPINEQGLTDRAQSRKIANRVRVENIYYINKREALDKIKHAKPKDRATPQEISIQEIERQQQKIASLRAEIRKMTINYAKRPRSITLTASTRKAVEAGYLAKWVSKIEHIGNLNYPAEAEVKKINGRLRLNVRINSLGEVIDTKVTKSSGEALLDEAARRIVRLAQPFDAFPAELKKRADQIVIVRTWDFNSNKLTTSGGS